MLGIARRNWALRLSVVLNVCVLLYVCVHFSSSGPWLEEPPTNWAAPLTEVFGAIETTNGTHKTNSSSSSIVSSSSSLSSAGSFSFASPSSSSSLALSSIKQQQVRRAKDVIDKSAMTNVSRSHSTKATSDESKTNASSVDREERNQERQRVNGNLASKTLQEAILCNDKLTEPKTAQRGDYWVLYNYVPMSMKVRCWESVTYTTHADYNFLDNLEPLLERWRAPISIAMHAPGTDFPPTLAAIKYLRSCGSPLVSQLVTFHVYFSSKHVPKAIPPSDKVISESYNCTLGPPWISFANVKMYKTEKKLLYPVNVGRNIARESAPTHYIFPSDIELYPSPNLPPKFLEMIRKRDEAALHKPNPKVFVLPIFEVDGKSQAPANKTILRAMLKAGSAIPFHKKLCSGCHNIPRSKEWQDAPETEGLHVFHVGKRIGTFVHWEPIFIGTNNDPLYDERLSWEGKSDKMTQGYALCVLDYDFLILDNAYLVHRPGIKVYKKDVYRDMLTVKTNLLIKKIIFPELKVLYGTRKGCAV